MSISLKKTQQYSQVVSWLENHLNSHSGLGAHVTFIALIHLRIAPRVAHVHYILMVTKFT
jgi:hypothetical protein